MRARPPIAPHRSAVLEDRARHLRHQMTPSEAALWSCFSAGKLGVRFQRQVPVAGRFIADFLAPAARLIVEVDGPCHRRRAAADARRDRALRRLGYRVLRLEAELVTRSVSEAVARVVAALREVP